MPLPKIRRRTFLSWTLLFAGFNLALQAFPDPPAVQEARTRKWALAQRQREEAYTRAMERRIEEFERENPGAFGVRWEEEDDDGGVKNRGENTNDKDDWGGRD